MKYTTSCDCSRTSNQHLVSIYNYTKICSISQEENLYFSKFINLYRNIY
nr:MAG TPA: hypothetical protein [Caudoviricetes sp.]